MVGISADVMSAQLENAESATEVMTVEITMAPLQHALDGVVLSTQPYVTTPHEYFTPEYTLTAMPADTYSLAAVPVLQGAVEADPKACVPIALTAEGRVMLVRAKQFSKAKLPMVLTPVGMWMLDKLLQVLNAAKPIAVTPVGISTTDRLVHSKKA